MAETSREPAIPAVRELLLAAFTVETLVRFCQDRPLFRPVLNEFGLGHGLADMVDEVIEFCKTQRLWDELLREVAQANPRQYAFFRDRLYQEPPSEVAGPSPSPDTRTKWPWEPPRPTWFWLAVGGVVVVLIVMVVSLLPPPGPVPDIPTRTPPPNTTQPTDTPEPMDEVLYVPNLQSEVCDRVEKALEDSHLRLGGKLWEVNSEVSYPRVIRTDPPEGRQVEHDSEVTVVCSLGPMRAAPHVEGQYWEDAVAWLEGECCPPPSFKTRLEYEIASKPEEVDTVIWTDPPGGKDIEPGSLVVLYIGVAPAKVRMPVVENMTVEEASERLEALHLSVGMIASETSEAVAADRVIRSEPPSGEMVEPGTSITLVVSGGSKAVIIPNVIDWTQETAEAELERLGFQVTQVDQQYHNDILEGNIIDTDPYAGKSVMPGHGIKLVVSLGLDPEGDHDNDGMSNGEEVKEGTDPRNPDTDQDCLKDGEDPSPREAQITTCTASWVESLSTLSGHSERVWSVAFSPDGRELASGALDNTVRIWLVDSGKHTLTFSEARDGSTMKAVLSVAFSPDGQLLASGQMDVTIRLWNMNTRDLETLDLTQENEFGPVSSVAFSPDGSQLASGSNSILLWSMPRGIRTHTLRDPGAVWAVAFSSQGRLASGSSEGNIRLWDAVMGAELATLEGHSADVMDLAFSPDGNILASASADNTIRLWQVASGQTLRTLTGHVSVVTSVAFSPDGTLLISGSKDKTVRLWRVQDGELLHTLTGHTGWVNSVACSPDGRLLASGSDDRTVRLWHVAD